MAHVQVTSMDQLRSSGETLRAALVAAGVRVVAGFVTNGANLVHAKSMPVARTVDFVVAGAGMSPVYAGYALDGSIQFTGPHSAVGDLRLRLDPQTVRVVEGGLALGAVDVVHQDGTLDPSSPRSILDRRSVKGRSSMRAPPALVSTSNALALTQWAPSSPSASRRPRRKTYPADLKVVVDPADRVDAWLDPGAPTPTTFTRSWKRP